MLQSFGSDEMVTVCFVCLGNICRSPMAEGLFKKIVKDQHLDHKIKVISRATSSWEVGNPPHPRTQEILHNLNISTKDMFSEKINNKDFELCDYLIGMDHDNVSYLKYHAKGHQHKVHLLRDIHDETKGEIIPDPYYTGTYQETYQMLNESLVFWLDKIKKENHF